MMRVLIGGVHEAQSCTAILSGYGSVGGSNTTFGVGFAIRR
jgi:hypothetical protein